MLCVGVRHNPLDNSVRAPTKTRGARPVSVSLKRKLGSIGRSFAQKSCFRTLKASAFFLRLLLFVCTAVLSQLLSSFQLKLQDRGEVGKVGWRWTVETVHSGVETNIVCGYIVSGGVESCLRVSEQSRNESTGRVSKLTLCCGTKKRDLTGLNWLRS